MSYQQHLESITQIGREYRYYKSVVEMKAMRLCPRPSMCRPTSMPAL